MKPTILILTLAATAAAAATAPTLALAEPVLPRFDPADFAPGAAIDNPYFPLHPGFRRDYLGQVTEEDGTVVSERTRMRWAGPGPVIAGVATWMILDEAFQDGTLVERTQDFYAQDRAGNVWYMGEDVTNLHYDDAGKLTGNDHDGTWRAGVNGALSGHAMPAHPRPGLEYEQEHAPQDQALDRALVLKVDDRQSGPMGEFSQVLAVFETSAVEPDLREVKYYAPGIGLIAEDEAVDATYANPQARFDLVGRAD